MLVTRSFGLILFGAMAYFELGGNKPSIAE